MKEPDELILESEPVAAKIGKHQGAPGLHQGGTRAAARWHQEGTRTTPGWHQGGTRAAPGLLQGAPERK